MNEVAGSGMNKGEAAAGGRSNFERDYWRAAPRLDESLQTLAPDNVSEHEFRLLADHIPTLCWIANGDGYIVWYNRRWHEYCGTTPEQMEGWGWQSVHDPALLPEVMERWTKSVATGEPFEMTFPLKGADGVFRPFLTRIQPVRDSSGAVVRWFGVNTEITAQTAVEAALRESEARFRGLLSASNQVLYRHNADWSQMRQLAGGGFLADTESPDPNWFDAYIHPDDQPHVWSVIQQAIQNKSLFELEHRVRREDGTFGWTLSRSIPILGDDGEIIEWFGAASDVSGRHEAEQALRESEGRFRAMADSAPMPAWVTSESGIEFANQALAEFAGMEPDELLGDTWTRLVHPDELQGVAAVRAEAWAKQQPYQFEARFRRSDGEWRWLQVNSRPRFDGAGALLGYVGMAVDLTEMRRAEAELRASEARFREVFQNAAIGMIEIDADWNILMSNEAYRDITGRSEEELQGASCLSFTHPEDVGAGVEALQALASDEAQRVAFEKRYVRPDGVIIWVRSSLSRVSSERSANRFLKVVEDITEVRQAREALAESEERYRLALSATNDAIWDWDFVSGHVQWNEALKAAYGHKLDSVEPTAQWWIDHIHPDDRQRIDDSIHSLIDGKGSHWSDEYRFRRADGSYAAVLDRGAVVRDGNGRAVRMIGAMFDLSERKRAEEALASSSERLRLATEAAAIGTWDFDPRSGELRWDQRVKELFGLSPDAEVDYNVFLKGLHPDDREATDAAVKRALEPDGPGRYDVEYRTVGIDDGVERWIAAKGRSVFEHGETVRFIGTVIDISERKRAEQDLAESRQALQDESEALEILNRTAALVAAELDLDRLVQSVVDAGVELTGAQFGAFFYNVVDQRGEGYMLYAISGVDRSHFESFPMPRKTSIFAPTFNGEGTVRSDDITQDPRYGRSEPYKGMPEGHLPVRSYLAVPVVSRSGEVIGGLFFGHEAAGIFSDRSERLMSGLAAQAAIGIDNARLFKASQSLNQTLEQRVTEEVARRSEAEERLRQAQKMETVGQLTGGLAHDFNNLLQIVTGNLDILLRILPDDQQRLRRSAENAMRGADRASTLTQRLLAFSRRQPLSPKPIDPNKLVSGMEELLHRTLGETVAVETVLSPGLWRIEADPNQLENTILNLAVNARDAMPDGGKLTIETANAHLDHGYVAQNAEVSAGQYVVICVSDTGTGMDDQTLARVFEPFFTTKEVGKGTGLGLSMVYGFVKQSGGHVKVYSEVGEGTTVKIYLPRLLGGHDEDEEKQEPLVPEGTREECILVCEDDDDVRAYSVEVLRELGYRVLEAHDGPAALHLLGRKEERIDLLFTDVVLPGGMTGAVVAEEARKLRPELKVLFTTGYARNAIVHQGRLDPGVELITKPFSFADLAARVRDLLDAWPAR